MGGGHLRSLLGLVVLPAPRHRPAHRTTRHMARKVHGRRLGLALAITNTLAITSGTFIGVRGGGVPRAGWKTVLAGRKVLAKPPPGGGGSGVQGGGRGGSWTRRVPYA